MTLQRHLLVSGFRAEPRSQEDVARMPFLAGGPVAIEFRSSLTFLVGENGSGKTTLLAALAARLHIRPGGGGSFKDHEDLEGAECSECVTPLRMPRFPRLQGLFLRAEHLARDVEAAGRVRMATTGEWRRGDQQSRGEGGLSLVDSLVDPSERKLYLLDEPETGLSPARQFHLLAMLDALSADGRSQAIVATHSPILMAHPDAEILWLDGTGISRRALEDVPHWVDVRTFTANPARFIRHLRSDS